MSIQSVAAAIWAGVSTQAQIVDTFNAVRDKSYELAITKTLDLIATSEKLFSTNWSAVISQVVAKSDAEELRSMANALTAKIATDPAKSVYWSKLAETISQQASLAETKFALMVGLGPSASLASSVNKFFDNLSVKGAGVYSLVGYGIYAQITGMEKQINDLIAQGKTQDEIDTIVAKEYIKESANTAFAISEAITVGIAAAPTSAAGLWATLRNASIQGVALSLAFEGGYYVGTNWIYEPNLFGINDGIQATIDKAVELLTVVDSATAYPSEISSIAFLVSVLDPSLTRDKLNQYLQSSANDYHNYKELNAFVNGIRHTLLGDVADVNAAQPDQFFKDIVQTIQAVRALFGTASFTLTAPPTSASEARSDFGAFLSLYYLTPFALKPTDAAANDYEWRMAA